MIFDFLEIIKNQLSKNIFFNCEIIFKNKINKMFF